MIVAFCLYTYFPYGGLQRDFMRVAREVESRGHTVRVYTCKWEGERPQGFEIIEVPVKAFSNHSRNTKYAAWVAEHLRVHPADRIVGFNKMPGLDVYYAADECFVEKNRGRPFLYRLTGRYRHYAAFEKAVFEKGCGTQLLMLSDRQVSNFTRHYGTEPGRFHMLPPGIPRSRCYTNYTSGDREAIRTRNGIGPETLFLLQVGSDFKRKGVARSLKAIAALPADLRSRVQFFVVGQDRPDAYRAQAESLGIAKNVQFFGGRDDVGELMAAADVLLHPAFHEAAGMVLIEAIVAGLPSLISGVCGYAGKVAEAGSGIVLPEPFEDAAMARELERLLSDAALRAQLSARGRAAADTTDYYSLPQKAADIIEGKN